MSNPEKHHGIRRILLTEHQLPTICIQYHHTHYKWLCLKHYNSHTATSLFIYITLFINATSYRSGPPVEQVVVQLAVSRAELLLVEEEGVVEKGEGIKDIEAVLYGMLASCRQHNER